jgi:polyhydroxyalkanoate synthase subunit PhaC
MNAPGAGFNLDQLFEQVNAANQSVVQDWMGKLDGNALTSFAETYQQFVAALGKNAGEWPALQQKYYQDQFDLWMSFVGRKPGGSPVHGEPEKGDRRFSAAEWSEYPLFNYIKQSYLLTSRWLMEAVETANLDSETRKKMLFFTRQYIDAMSPANFLATNPEVLKLAVESKGESLAKGLHNLLADLQKGRISMTDEAQFAVGKNIALSAGSIVFENDLIQLIQYAPIGAKVFERPLLMVPPCINKFYIMDLEPENSFVRYALEQGHTVFMISWRNPQAEQQHLTWDEYLSNGVIKATEVAREICKIEKINILGFCVGGTLVACALGVLAARKQAWIESITLMTTLLEFSDVGDIGVYVDRKFVAQREKQFESGGLVPGKELALAFSSLRANDLIWFYVVNNYLKGKTPDAFNLLYWNSDATNLPGPMYSYYLRNCYLENHLGTPGKLVMCGEKIDLGKIAAAAYIFAAREDHIVPWKSAFASTQFLGGKAEYVLGASGHIAGSMNPVSKNKRNYWAGGELKKGADHWLETAQSKEGSWWPHWAAWLGTFGGRKIAARTKLGGVNSKPIEAAPGRYVLARIA